MVERERRRKKVKVRVVGKEEINLLFGGGGRFSYREDFAGLILTISGIGQR
jgi:hypothetical protein